MNKFLLIFVFVGLSSSLLFAQEGHYFLSHYQPGSDNISYLSFDIQQDNNGILYFGNRTGVLQFDGRTWTMVPIKGAVYSLAVTKTGEVYAAGSSGFGKIGLNEKNQLSYLSLSDSLQKAKNIIASCAMDSAVFFLNEDHLFKYNFQTREASLVIETSKELGLFNGLSQIGNHLYVNTENQGLRKISGKQLVHSETEALKGIHFIFSERSPDGKTDFIATEDHRFFLLKEGEPVREFKPNDVEILSSNVVVNGTWVTERLVALGTLRGGVIFVDCETGETKETLDYYSGLPDNEVFALHTDRHQGIWVAHDYGFTRVAPFLPFRTYNHYAGLVGHLLCVQSAFQKVYVGTTLGLFLLSKEAIYEEEVYDVELKVAKGKAAPPIQEIKEDRKKSKRGLLGFLKKKPPEPDDKKEPVAVAVSKPNIRKVKKTRQVLKGMQYVYKRIEGITGKVDQLMVVGNKLICGGVGGVFEVRDMTAISVDREPVRTIFYSNNLKQLLVSTYNDEIKSFRPTAKSWDEVSFPDSLSTYADYMFEDNLQDLWICGRDRALKVGIEDGQILDAESIPLPHPSVDKTVGLAYGQEVYLTQNGEFYHYASFKNAFIKYDSLPGPKKYFASAGFFWFYDGHKWRTVDKRLQGSMKTEWLALFPDIRFLAPAEAGKSLWVITAANELYKFSSEQGEVSLRANPLFLKEVRNQQSKLAPIKILMVDEGESALTLEFIQPEYVSLQAVEYRYWVQGLQPGWSDWSSLNNIINFPFLPPGNYKVAVQSKDLFGKITELDTIDFNVVPPYWKRPWFYAVEFLFFGFLVVLTLRLKGASKKYRYLSRFLSALTVIMLIQFIQTIASSTISLKSTPVADFFIQVLIALLVLPVEDFLRNRILSAENVKI